MPRGDQLGRQWKIIHMLLAAHTGKTVAEIASEIEAHQRTVYRDLEALQGAGFPITSDRMDGRSLWYILESYKKQIPLPLNLQELMALYFSLDMLRGMHDAVFYASLESLFHKIRATLPPESSQYLKNLQETLIVDQKHYKRYGKYKEIIAAINEATMRRRTIEITYFALSKKSRTTRRVDPYKVWFFNTTFYLVGYCHLRREIRIFALDRIRSLKQTPDLFNIPQGFDMGALMSGSFGVFRGEPVSVRIAFNPEIAGYIEEKVWHESQRIDRQPDGSIIFEASVAVNEELVTWILGWGAKARVLSPQHLIDAVCSETACMADQYEGSCRRAKKSAADRQHRRS